MKEYAVLLGFLLCNYSNIYSQKDNWELFSKETILTIDISKTGTKKINDLTLDFIWDNKLSYSENIGNYGGIKSLAINKGNNELQTIYDIEDNLALGNISFDFYDYNFDGFIDFSIPLNCGKICWKKYYLFNPKLSLFEHRKDWDYLRIQKIDKTNKQILSQPNGNAFEDNRKLYQIKGLQLIELE